MEGCGCVGTQHNGQKTGAGDVLSGGSLVGVCLCCWRSAWIVVRSGVVLLVALGGCLNDEGVPAQRVTKHEKPALDKASRSWS